MNQNNQVPHLTQDTVLECDKNTRNIIYKRAKRSTISQQVTTRLHETDMKVWQRQTQIAKKIHKRSTDLEQSVRKLLESLNKLHGTNLTFDSNVDQDIEMFGLNHFHKKTALCYGKCLKRTEFSTHISAF